MKRPVDRRLGVDEVEGFLDQLRALPRLHIQVRNTVEELVTDDPDVSDEELGWAAIDMASSTIQVPDDLELDDVGAILREELDQEQ